MVPDNPINQQIAIRYIRALKFPVTAVFNGKEALEYLLKATSADLSPEEAREYPVPALILMDVQMPVLDGYHATHLLRYHAPFTTIAAIPRIPIVAMTASAVQGDREKCEKAGMDDYMSKPVKRSLLESTILKWVTTSRRNTGTSHRELPAATKDAGGRYPQWCTDNSSTCTEHDAILVEFFAPSVQGDQSSTPVAAGSGPASDITDAPGRAYARRSSISKTLLKTEIAGGETEGDLAMRRSRANDKAQTLRDAKLMSITQTEHGQPPGTGNAFRYDHNLSNPPPPVLFRGSEPGSPPSALTEANMTLFNSTRESKPEGGRSPFPSTGSEYLDDPVSQIPGPPPEGVLLTVDLADHDDSTDTLVDPLPVTEAEAYQTWEAEMRTGDGEEKPAKGRPLHADLLSSKHRTRSDMSTSTVRAEKE